MMMGLPADAGGPFWAVRRQQKLKFPPSIALHAGIRYTEK